MNRPIVLWACAACSLAAGAAALGEPLPPTGQIITFRNEKSGRCIGVDHASTANGALVKQFDCDGRPNQQWRVVGRTSLQNVKSGKCMGVDHGSTAPGANIGQFDCDPDADRNLSNQSWELVGLEGSMVRGIVNEKTTLSHGNRRFCIGVDHGSTDNGAQLKQFPCDDISLTRPSNQAWQVECLLCMSHG